MRRVYCVQLCDVDVWREDGPRLRPVGEQVWFPSAGGQAFFAIPLFLGI